MTDERERYKGGTPTVRVPRPPARSSALERPPTGPSIDVRAREAAAEAMRRTSQTEEQIQDALEGAKRHNDGLERELGDVRAGLLVVARAIGADKQLPQTIQRSIPPPPPWAPRPSPSLDARARVTVLTNYLSLAILVLYAVLEIFARVGLLPPPPPIPTQTAPIQQQR